MAASFGVVYMAVRYQRLRKILFRVVPVLAALAAFLISLLLVSDLDQDAGGDGWHYMWVLIVTGLALLVLLAMITYRVISLVRKVRHGAPGARLSARWVRNFLALSLPPALIVYFFSAYFLTRTVDSWFDVQVEAALADSLALGQQFLDTRTLEVRNQLRRLGLEVEGLDDDPDLLRRALLNRISASGPTELSVLQQNGRIMATANFDALADLPDRPGDYALLQAQQRGEYAAAEPSPGGGLQIRVIQALPSVTPAQPDLLLQAIFPLPENITALTGSIEQEYYRYQNVSYLRNSLKQSFLLILSLVLLLTIFLAILAALNTARRMVSPISRLAQATRKVAGGDLGQAVEIRTRDELGFLARSFNDMTQALLQASEEAESGRARLEAQGKYLETVLGSLSAGVLTLGHDDRIVRVNRAAEQILGLPAGYALERPLADIAAVAPYLDPFAQLIRDQSGRSRSGWQRELRLHRAAAPLVLLVRGSRLTGPDGDERGQVIVFDDVTVLNQAQRDAAWSEVARRLAHEVKNPLTPIRLAAERLRLKLLDRLDTADGAMLQRSTQTIISQVEALRTMVDAFGEYANEPDLSLSPLRLDQLVEDVVTLYRQGNPDLDIELALCPGPEGLNADAGRVRQLLHNLIRNASEAGPPGEGASILIATRLLDANGRASVELQVADRGPGFPEAVLAKPFEPYVTSKPNGSGLGLAICRKIVEEHDGRISIENRPGGGARAMVVLPLGGASTVSPVPRGTRPGA
jgi:PAS domain S-box-containing protein